MDKGFKTILSLLILSGAFLLGDKLDLVEAASLYEISDPLVQAHKDLVKLEAECDDKGGMVRVAPGTSELRLELIDKYGQAVCF